MRLPFSLRAMPMPGRWHLPAAGALYATALNAAYRDFDQHYSVIGNPDPATEDFVRAIEAITGTPHSDGNRIDLLFNGDQIFPAMLDAIRSATATINFLTYVYWRGDIGTAFADAIAERARAGVRCNVLLDAIGAQPIDPSMIHTMQQAGARVEWFRPINWKNITRLDNRTHRKILVVDGRIGFTGGVGIAPEWTGNAQDKDHWRDTHLRLEGPAVRGLQGAFCDEWAETTRELLAGPDYIPHIPPLPGGALTQVTRSAAGKGNTSIETLFFLAIAMARTRLWITSAYLVPRQAFTKALTNAAERGVDVRILVPGPHSNKIVVREAGRHDYAELIAGKTRIYEYQPTMLHAKTITVDGVWTSIGSANFDNRSFALNDEINVSIHDARLTGQLDAQFERDIARATEITPDVWRKRSVPQRVIQAVSSVAGREL